MLRLIASRAGQGLLTILAVTLLIFVLTQLLPGDVAEAVLGEYATPETLAALRTSLNLDQPAPLRYLQWLADLARGDLGVSLASGQPLGPLVGGRLYNTVFLAAVTAAIAVPLAMGLGILAVLYANTLFDRVLSSSTLVIVSLPDFFLGYVVIILFARELGVFESVAQFGDGATFGEKLYAIALPVFTLVLILQAQIMRMTRVAIMEVMDRPFIDMARLKGTSEIRVVLFHALPSAIGPIANVVAMNLAFLLVGVIIAEVVFVYPGIGQLLVDAVSMRDVTTVQICGLIIGTVYVGLNLIADIIAIVSNPRILHPRS
jgi:peptide/nickel transport system permease protein